MFAFFSLHNCGMMLRKLPQDSLEDRSTNAVKSIFNDENWDFIPVPRDKSGIDAEVEVIHGIQRTGKFLKVQLKAGLSYLSSETEEQLRVRVETKYLQHWNTSNVPILLVYFHPDLSTAYWKDIRECVRAMPSLVRSTADTKIVVFDKQRDILDSDAFPLLEQVAEGKFRYDKIVLDGRQWELGWSNWFPIRSIPSVWVAPTEAITRADIAPFLSKDYAFTVKNGDVITFCDLRKPECELRAHCEVAKAQPRLAQDIEDVVLVEILNQTVNISLQRRGLEPRGERFTFPTTILGTPELNKFAFKSLKGRDEERTKVYRTRSGNKVEHKHHAVRLSFVKHGGTWFLQIDPDWFFSYPYPFRPGRGEVGARITSEKAATHNKIYLYLLHFWRRYLSDNSDLIRLQTSSTTDKLAIEVSVEPETFELPYRFFNDYIGPRALSAARS